VRTPKTTRSPAAQGNSDNERKGCRDKAPGAADRRGIIEGVTLVGLTSHSDGRGHLTEIWRRESGPEAAGFVQDNVSLSSRNVLRGLHLQKRHPQGKLVIPLRGRIFDVVVDARKDSATFGCWQGFDLAADDKRGLWIPPGLAHGFHAAEDDTMVLYKCTSTYDAPSQLVLAWDDPELAIGWPWPDGGRPVLSARDQTGLSWRDFLAELD